MLAAPVKQKMEPKYVCVACEKSFAREGNFKKHKCAGRVQLAPKEEPEEIKAAPVQYKCEFCDKTFSREGTFYSHVCEKKRRWLTKDDKHVRMGFMMFRKFHEISFRSQKPRSYDDFMNSSHYKPFVNFGKHLLDIQAINPPQFLEFLMRVKVPMKRWHESLVYEHYIRELNKKETASAAAERNILLMEQWAMDSELPWTEFFKEVNTNVATRWITSGRLSPWILYTATTAQYLFERMTDEQLAMVQQYVDPRFWQLKFEREKAEVEFLKALLAEAGV